MAILSDETLSDEKLNDEKTISSNVQNDQPSKGEVFTPNPSGLVWVERWTELLDSKFTIPGTNLRFGIDFLMGLVPGLGDTVSLGFSGVLIATMAKKGASGQLVVRMLLNVLFDTVFGSIPILGNVFDLYFKANQRNLRLMQEHYGEGKHSGSAWPLLALIGSVLLAAFALIVWGSISLASYLIGLFQASMLLQTIV